jgi:hypothetical protein
MEQAGMNLIFYKKDSLESLTIQPGIEKGKLWLSRRDGEAGDFPAQEVENVIYEALDKYFRENH